MARAKYFDGNGYKDWTADMVGGLSKTGISNGYIRLFSSKTNSVGYYLVARKTFTGPWENSRAVWMIASRHDGTGIVSIVAGSFGEKTKVYGDISLFSSKKEFLTTPKIVGVMHDNIFDIYVHISDWEEVVITPLLLRLESDSDFIPYRGDWVETLPSGIQVPAKINGGQQIYVQSSAPTDSDAVLWVQT